MSRWALIEGGRAALIVEQDDEPGIEGLWVAAGSAALGDRWDGSAWQGPLAWGDADLDPRYWWIDPGPFKDRLGADALAIAAADDGICRAVQAMLADRKYVDLRSPTTAALVDLLIDADQPAADARFSGSGPMDAGKRSAILDTPTTDAERHIKGLPQPVGAP